MRKFSHWVFDMDGTLIDSSPFYDLIMDQILREIGHVPTPQDIDRAYLHFNPEEYFVLFAQEPKKIQYAVQRLSELNRLYAEKMPVFEGIEELFLFLKSKGIRISVWTGRETQSAEQILKATGLHQYVDHWVGRSCVPKNKPFPDGLLKILSDSRHHEDDVVMVGDHVYDMQGAKAAKVLGVSVGWDSRVPPGARELSALHFDRVREMISWAQSLYR